MQRLGLHPSGAKYQSVCQLKYRVTKLVPAISESISSYRPSVKYVTVTSDTMGGRHSYVPHYCVT